MKFLNEIALKVNLPIHYINYPLAPQNKYPIALEFIRSYIESLSLSFNKLILMGDSAGGNLAIELVNKELKVDKLILLCPVINSDIDAELTTESYKINFNDVELPLIAMRMFIDFYGKPFKDKFNFKKFPPTLLITAEHDVLFSEAKDFSSNLNEVIHYHFKGMLHDFFAIPPLTLPATDKLIGLIVDYIIDH